MGQRHIRGPEVADNLVLFKGAGGYAMLDEVTLVVKKTSGAATAVTLPANPVVGQVVEVKDGKGDAGSNNITIAAPGGVTIDGAASLVLNANYDWVRLRYNGAEWNAVG